MFAQTRTEATLNDNSVHRLTHILLTSINVNKEIIMKLLKMTNTRNPLLTLHLPALNQGTSRMLFLYDLDTIGVCVLWWANKTNNSKWFKRCRWIRRW